MRMSTRNPVFLVGAAVVLIVVAGLAYALWQESRTETVRFQFGEESIEIEAEG